MSTPRIHSGLVLSSLACLAVACAADGSSGPKGAGDDGSDGGPMQADSAPPAASLDAGTPDGPGAAVDGGARDGGVPAIDGGARDGAVVPPPPVCTDPSDTWRDDLVDDRPGFKPRVAAAVGADGRLRLAYNVAESDDGWSDFGIVFAEEKADGYATTPVTASNGHNAEYPSLLVDETGTAHVFFNRYVPEEEQIDLFLASGSASGFAPPINLTNTDDADEIGASVARAPDGTVHIVFLRRIERDPAGRYDYSVGYLNVESGTVSEVETLADPGTLFDGHPQQAIAVGADGAAHALFRIPADAPAHAQLVYRRRSPAGDWSEAREITGADENAGGGSIAVDDAGDVHLAFALGTVDKTMAYRRIERGALGPLQMLGTSTDDRPYYLGLAAEGDGTVHLTYRRLYEGNADVLYRRGSGGTFEAETRITESATGDEITAVMAVGPCGDVHIAYLENLSEAPNGKVFLAELE